MVELHSRCSVEEFKFEPSERKELLAQIFKRCIQILDAEKVTYDRKAIAELVSKLYPEFRKTMIELQRCAVHGNGHIDAGSFRAEEEEIISLIKYIKEKDFTGMRRYVGENDLDDNEIYRRLFDMCDDVVVKEFVPDLTMLVNKYQVQATMAIDKQINLVAFLTEVMASVEFKWKNVRMNGIVSI